MAQRQIGTDENEIAIDYDDVSEAVENNERTEQDILTEIGASADHADYECRVFQIPTAGTKRIWLFNVPGQQAKTILERLRDEYGTGTYEIRIWQTVNGKTKPAKNHIQTVAIRRPDAATLPTSQSSGSDNALALLVRQQGEALQTLMQRLNGQPQILPAQSPTDPGAMFLQMASMAKAMRELMGSPAPAPDPMAMLSSVVQLVKSANSEERDKSVLEQVMEFAQSDAVKLVLQSAARPPVAMLPNQMGQMPGIAAAPAALPPQPPQQPQPVRVAPAPAQPVGYAQPQPTQPATDDVAQRFADLLRFIVDRLSRNSDPVLCADIISEDVDPEMLRALIALPDPVAFLAQYNPDVMRHEAQFREIIEVLSEPVEESDLTTQPNAARNAGAHVSTSPNGHATNERSPHAADVVDVSPVRSGGST